MIAYLRGELRDNDGETVIVEVAGVGYQVFVSAATLGTLPAMNAEVSMVPQNVVHLEGKEAVSAVKLVALLEDSDDVQNVFSNMDVDESVLESGG